MARRFNSATSDQLDPSLSLAQYTDGATGTVMCWVRIAGSPVDNANVYNLTGIIADLGGFFGLYRGTISGGADQIWAFVWDGAEKKVGGSFVLGRWTHVAMRWDSSNLELFIDGQSAGTTAAGAITDVTGDMRFGVGFATVFFNGDLAQIAFYGATLRSSYIRNVAMRRELPQKYGALAAAQNPTGYWPLRGFFSPEPELWFDRSAVVYTAAPSLDPPRLRLFLGYNKLYGFDSGQIVDGTGTPTLPKITAAGTGTAAHTATGTPTLPKITAAGTGVAAHQGTGTPTLPKITAAGVATAAHQGTGTPSLFVPTMAGVATSSHGGTGTPTLFVPSMVGVAVASHVATGTPSLFVPTMSGSGASGHQGSGSPSLPLPTMSGSGSETPPGGMGMHMGIDIGIGLNLH